MNNKELINQLNENALYKISMSSIELFHTNFWSWMFNKYKSSLKYFFEDIINVDDFDNLDVRREYKHTDICILDDQSAYIIENKIKSLPDNKQLEKYQGEKYERKPFKIGIITSIVKLNIIQEMLDKDHWVYLDYNDISRRIKNFMNFYISENKDYDRFDFELLSKYCDMIEQLYHLMSNELVERNQYLLDTCLTDIGFGIVYKKFIGTLLVNQILNYHRFSDFKPYLEENGVTSDINRTQMTLTIKLSSIEENTSIGIQISNYEYRWFISKWNDNPRRYSDKEKKRLAAEEVFNSKKQRFPKWLIGEGFNRYVTENYTFVYQKKEPFKPNILFSDMIDRIINDVCFLQKQGYIKKTDKNLVHRVSRSSAE